MGGKITNVLIGISNIFIGIIIFVYEFINIQNAVSFTKYQNEVMRIFRYVIFGYIVLNSIINFIYTFYNKMEPKLRKSYLLFLPSLAYIIYPHIAFAAIPLLAGIVLIVNILRKNFVEADSQISSSISTVLIFLSTALIIGIIFNNVFANSLKEKDKIGLKEYDEGFFKLVSPIENEDPKYRDKYINIKKDDKFGYINQNGEKITAFDLDFATPFYLIDKNDQKYYIGGFTKGDITEVVLKNGRVIFSYKSENEIYDYKARIKEFEDIVKEKIKPKIFQIEIPSLENYYVYSPVYDEPSKEERLKKEEEKPELVWTYRYDYNEEYDLLVTESVMGFGNKYELAKKDDLNNRKKLEAEYLIYDKDKLYTLPGGYIPFFNPKEKISGYFEPNGNRKKLKGTAKILYVEKDRVLIKNESKKTAYFIDSATGKEVSPSFKEIIVDSANNRYIVKNNNDKWMMLNKNFERIFKEEFDIVKTDLLKAGIYVFGNFPENLELNEYNYVKINYIFANSNLDTIEKNINFFYNSYDKIDKKNISVNDYEEIKNKISNPKPNKILNKYYDLIFNKEKIEENVLSEIEKEKKVQGPEGNKDLRDQKLKDLRNENKELEQREKQEEMTPTGPMNEENLAPSLPELENAR